MTPGLCVQGTPLSTPPLCPAHSGEATNRGAAGACGTQPGSPHSSEPQFPSLQGGGAVTPRGVSEASSGRGAPGSYTLKSSSLPLSPVPAQGFLASPFLCALLQPRERPSLLRESLSSTHASRSQPPCHSPSSQEKPEPSTQRRLWGRKKSLGEAAETHRARRAQTKGSGAAPRPLLWLEGTASTVGDLPHPSRVAFPRPMSAHQPHKQPNQGTWARG